MGSHACCTSTLDKSFPSDPLFLSSNFCIDGLFIDSFIATFPTGSGNKDRSAPRALQKYVFLPPQCSPGQSQAICLRVPTTVARANSQWDPISNPFTRLMSSLSFIPLSLFVLHLFSKCHQASRGWKSSTAQPCLEELLTSCRNQACTLKKPK